MKKLKIITILMLSCTLSFGQFFIEADSTKILESKNKTPFIMNNEYIMLFDYFSGITFKINNNSSKLKNIIYLETKKFIEKRYNYIQIPEDDEKNGLIRIKSDNKYYLIEKDGLTRSYNLNYYTVFNLYDNKITITFYGFKCETFKYGSDKISFNKLPDIIKDKIMMDLNNIIINYNSIIKHTPINLKLEKISPNIISKSKKQIFLETKNFIDKQFIKKRKPDYLKMK